MISTWLCGIPLLLTLLVLIYALCRVAELSDQLLDDWD